MSLPTGLPPKQIQKAQQNAKALIDRFDTNKNGVIDKSEQSQTVGYTVRTRWHAGDYGDSWHRDTLTVKDAAIGLTSTQLAEKYLKQYDQNNDGKYNATDKVQRYFPGKIRSFEKLYQKEETTPVSDINELQKLGPIIKTD
jgi:Ca2+-binding EF-hand superfamily protein